MIPHVAPPFWPESRTSRFAGAIYKNSADLLERPDALRQVAAKCRIGLIGLTDDSGIELNFGRPGAREGPHAFRAALARYGAANPMSQGPHSPAYPHVFDAGDIIAGQDLHETHDRVTQAVATLLDLGLLPVGIGGGHDLTFPFVRAVAQRSSPMSGVYLDAHLDVRPEPGSGMAFRRLIEVCGITGLTCIGADPLANSRDHFEWFIEHGGRLGEVDDAATAIWSLPPDPALPYPPTLAVNQFVSIDLDVLDSAYAPGVSAVNPAGLTPRQVAVYAYEAGRNNAVRCIDIMELSPVHDHEGRTARVAAHLFLQFLRGFAEREPGTPGNNGD